MSNIRNGLNLISNESKSDANFCQTPVQSPSFSFRLRVVFGFPLSQEQQQEQQKPHQTIAENSILEVVNLLVTCVSLHEEIDAYF